MVKVNTLLFHYITVKFFKFGNRPLESPLQASAIDLDGKYSAFILQRLDRECNSNFSKALYELSLYKGNQTKHKKVGHFFYLTSLKEQYVFFPWKGCLNIKFQEVLKKQCHIQYHFL